LIVVVLKATALLMLKADFVLIGASSSIIATHGLTIDHVGVSKQSCIVCRTHLRSFEIASLRSSAKSAGVFRDCRRNQDVDGQAVGVDLDLFPVEPQAEHRVVLGEDLQQIFA
jgi:hypothetical protein